MLAPMASLLALHAEHGGELVDVLLILLIVLVLVAIARRLL